NSHAVRCSSESRSSASPSVRQKVPILRTSSHKLRRHCELQFLGTEKTYAEVQNSVFTFYALLHKKQEVTLAINPSRAVQSRALCSFPQKSRASAYPRDR